jgi:hypothetical protein
MGWVCLVVKLSGGGVFVVVREVGEGEVREFGWKMWD